MNDGRRHVIVVKHNGAGGDIAKQLRLWGFAPKSGIWEKDI
jgi:hypothetical protein